MKKSNSKIAIFGFIWLFGEKCGNQIITFFITTILARLLTPSIYGTVALIRVFTSLLSTFIDSGMGVALVQKKDVDELDFSTLFCFNILFSIIVYFLMFFLAPIIANFYNDVNLILTIRVLSLSLILSGIGNILYSYIYRNFLFKKNLGAHIIANIISGAIGIFLAYKNFGIWALVINILSYRLLSIIFSYTFIQWFPKIQFSFERIKYLFNYGSKLLLSKLIDRLFMNIGALIIGKYYTKSDLALYSKGRHFPGLIVENINGAIDGVLFPIMSKEQSSLETVKNITRMSIIISTYIIMPMMVGLAIIAEPLVRLLLTEKWIECVFYLRIACFTYMFYTINVTNLNAIKAIGRSDIFLYLEIIKKIISLIAMSSTLWISVKVFALSGICTCIGGQIINSWPNKKLLNYSYIGQFMDMLPQILLSVTMGIIIYPIKFLKYNDPITIMLQIIIGGLFYISASVILKIEGFEYLKFKVKNVFPKDIKIFR